LADHGPESVAERLRRREGRWTPMTRVL
jgi:hypothetical protein